MRHLVLIIGLAYVFGDFFSLVSELQWAVGILLVSGYIYTMKD